MATENDVERTAPAAVSSGVLAGLIAGIVMALVAMFRAWSLGFSFWFPVQQIAALFYGVQALIEGGDATLVGMLVHLAMSAAFGLIFGFLVSRLLSSGAALILGLIYGAVIWGLMTFIVLPIANPVMAERVALISGWWFVYHLIYGAVLALTIPFAKSMSRRRHGPYQAGETSAQPA